MSKYYAIREGFKTGIYREWEEVKTIVHGYPGAVYKSFYSKEEAEEFMNKGKEFSVLKADALTAKISYNKGSNPSDSYCIIDYYQNNEKLYEENVTINYNRNIKYEHDIEFLAVVRAMQRAIDLGHDWINIIYDYPGVLDYLTGYWTAREDSANIYIRRFSILNNKINVGFTRKTEDILY